MRKGQDEGEKKGGNGKKKRVMKVVATNDRLERRMLVPKVHNVPRTQILLPYVLLIPVLVPGTFDSRLGTRYF